MNNFIKSKIYVFNVTGIIFLIFSSIIFISNINKEHYHGYMRGFAF
jgi:hypothetical protein